MIKTAFAVFVGVIVLLGGCTITGGEETRVEYDEPYRPQFHFTPEENWMNDPNGPVYFEGEYHLFYQYNPFGTQWGHMSWGHAVSADLVHWEHLPIAIPEHDSTMIFSGSAVVDRHNTSGLCDGENGCLVAIYTAHTTDPVSQIAVQTQNLAYSNDRGRTWQRFSGNPVIDIHSADFRDPNVFWHEESQRWIMPVALSVERKIRLLASQNLIDWQHLSDFGPLGSTEGIWECPTLIHLPVEGDPGVWKWLMKVDVNPGHPAGGSGGQYFIGEFDGRAFIPDPSTPVPLWVDYGADFYCGLQWSNEPSDLGERTWIGWMSNWAYASETPTYPWRGAMTLPRSISLAQTSEGIRLVQRPVPAMEELRTSELSVTGSDLLEVNRTIADADPAGTTTEIIADITIGSAAEVGVRVAAGLSGEAAIGYDVLRRELYVDRTRAIDAPFADGFAARHIAPLQLDDDTLRLHIFVDRSSIEVFANDGRVVITDLMFPDPTETGIEVYANGGDVSRVSLDIWDLRSSWGPNPGG